MKRSSWLAVWIGLALAVGGIGGGLAGSTSAMRAANVVFALGFGGLAWRALGKGRTVKGVVLSVAALAFVLLSIWVSFTAPIYDVLGTIVDEM